MSFRYEWTPVIKVPPGGELTSRLKEVLKARDAFHLALRHLGDTLDLDEHDVQFLAGVRAAAALDGRQADVHGEVEVMLEQIRKHGKVQIRVVE